MPPGMREFLREDCFELFRCETGQRTGRQENRRPNPAHDGGNRHLDLLKQRHRRALSHKMDQRQANGPHDWTDGEPIALSLTDYVRNTLGMVLAKASWTLSGSQSPGQTF